MQIPSVKRLQQIAGIDRAQASLLRRLLEGKADPYEYCGKWIDSCYNLPSKHEQIMAAADKIIGGFGVEYIASGHNAKSPAIEYVNLGDAYCCTLMYVNGRYVVGDWGSIVERGNYD